MEKLPKEFETSALDSLDKASVKILILAPNGYIDRASSDLKSYYLQGSYVDDNTLIKAITFGGSEVTYQSWFGIDATTLANDRTFNPAGAYTNDQGEQLFYDNQVDNYLQDHYQLHWNQKHSRNWSTNLGLNYTYGRGYYEEFREDADFSNYNLEPLLVNGELLNTTDLVRRKWLDNDYYVVNINANYKNNEIDLLFGGSYSHYYGDHYGELVWARFASQSFVRERYYEGDGTKNDFSSFAKITYKFNDRLQLYGDLQLRGINYETSGISSDLVNFVVDEDYLFFNPKVGATYQLNDDNDLYFSFARANREPTRDDFENDPEVRPEQLNDFELGLRHKVGNLSFNANGYFMLYNEQLVLSGEINDVGAALRTNSGDSYRLGLELESVIPVTKKITLQTNVAVSRNRNKETRRSFDGELQNLGSTQIAYSPNVVAANAIVFEPKKDFQISLLSKFVGDQYMSNTEAEQSKLESYFVNDLNINYTLYPKSVFESIRLTGLINNIFDEKYVSNGYYFTYDIEDTSKPNNIATIEGAGYYPQAEINFLTGVTFTF